MCVPKFQQSIIPVSQWWRELTAGMMLLAHNLPIEVVTIDSG
jgi:hypothetical protein